MKNKQKCSILPLLSRCLVVFIALPLLIILPGCEKPQEIKEEVIPRVKVFVVGKKASGQSRRISGKVRASDKSTLGFGVNGKVVEIIAKDGETVIEGQLLARLDDEPFKLLLQKARANLNSVRAELVKAQAAFKRTSTLLKERAASQKDFDAAKATLVTANSNVESARGELEQSELDFAQTRLTAPFSGKVVDVPIDLFQEVSVGTGVLILQAQGALKVDVRIPETLIRELDYGQVVQVRFPTVKGLTASGVVTLIGAETEAGNAFPVTILLTKNHSDLRPGMTASVTFNFNAYLDGRIAYLIPLSAIAIEAGLAGSPTNSSSESVKSKNEVPVFVYNSTLQKIELRTLIVGDLRGNQIEVYEGLNPGDQVVSAGVTFMRDGMKANIWIPRS